MPASQLKEKLLAIALKLSMPSAESVDNPYTSSVY
jgi:hypothetical protein